MDVIYSHCASIDVHKKIAVCCCCTPGPDGAPSYTTRTFGTMTTDILDLAAWLTSLDIVHIVMESTGEYWKPFYNLLEATFTVLVVNAQHIKNVPGRKTDVKDAEWLVEVLRHGLVRGSFIPPAPQRELRDLTRQRILLVRERATVTNRLQKVLEWANLKLAGVASDVLGKSGRAMLDAIVDGQSDVAELADLARGRLRSKRAVLEQALNGRVTDHHRFLLAQHLSHVDFLDEQITRFDERITQHIQAQVPNAPELATSAHQSHAVTEAPRHEAQQQTELTWEEAIAIWDSVPGIGSRIAEQLVAEIGIAMERFPSAGHLASWAKVSPGNNESAGKRFSGKIGKGNPWLRTALVQAAHAAVHVKGSYLAAFYPRLAARRGAKKAIVAVAHKLLTIGYVLLQKRELYRDPGERKLDERRADQLLHRMQQRIEQLGYRVSLEPIPSAVT